MRIISLAVVALIALAPAAHAQGSYKKEVPDSLVKKAKISEAHAAEIAMKRVPKGKIESVELEKEEGQFLYSYDLRTPGKSGLDEVHIDAMTGKVISLMHETPAMEKKEAADEAKEMKLKAKSKKP